VEWSVDWRKAETEIKRTTQARQKKKNNVVPKDARWMIVMVIVFLQASAGEQLAPILFHPLQWHHLVCMCILARLTLRLPFGSDYRKRLALGDSPGKMVTWTLEQPLALANQTSFCERNACAFPHLTTQSYLQSSKFISEVGACFPEEDSSFTEPPAASNTITT
jgi:hypothetical protein